METIQVILDSKLLREADRVAKRTKQNRSALIRDASRSHLQQLKVKALEAQDRAGYLKHPQTAEGCLPWETITAWPEE